jgi:hypothetical protein
LEYDKLQFDGMTQSTKVGGVISQNIFLLNVVKPRNSYRNLLALLGSLVYGLEFGKYLKFVER